MAGLIRKDVVLSERVAWAVEDEALQRGISQRAVIRDAVEMYFLIGRDEVLRTLARKDEA